MNSMIISDIIDIEKGAGARISIGTRHWPNLDDSFKLLRTRNLPPVGCGPLTAHIASCPATDRPFAEQAPGRHPEASELAGIIGKH